MNRLIDISQFFQHRMSKLTDLEFQSPLFMRNVGCTRFCVVLLESDGVAKLGEQRFSYMTSFENIQYPVVNQHGNGTSHEMHLKTSSMFAILVYQNVGKKRPRKNDHLPPQLLLKCLEPPHFHQAFYRLLPFSPGKSPQNSPLEPGLRRDQETPLSREWISPTQKVAFVRDVLGVHPPKTLDLGVHRLICQKKKCYK